MPDQGTRTAGGARARNQIGVSRGTAPARTKSDRTLVDVTMRELRELILNGDLSPGSRLVLADLAERLSLSPIPVREAIQRLQVEGLVEQIPHRGAWVRPISTADLEDLYTVRVSLEGLAVGLAAARFDESDFERLSNVLDEYVAAYRRGNISRGREMHHAFHVGLYEIAGSRWLLRTIGPLWDAAERYRRLSARLRESLETRDKEHRQILEHCRRRDARAARAALEQHLLKSMALVKNELALMV